MRATDCLDNLIGIDRQCDGGTTPSSGLFINKNLTGMTNKIVLSAVNSENNDVIAVINQKITTAQNRLVSDFRTFLEPTMDNKTVVENDVVGVYQDDLESVASEAGKYWGVRAKIRGKEFYELHISSIDVKLDAAVTSNINVIDLMTGKIIDTFEFDSVADTPTNVIINKKYIVNRQRLQLLFAIDSSIADVYDADLHDHHDSCGTCHGHRNTFSPGHHIDWSFEEIGQVATLIDKNTRGIGHSGGLSVNYSLRCTVEPLICNMADILAWPFLHLVGMEILKEVKYANLNDRVTSITTVHSSKVEGLLADYKTEYDETMATILKGLALRDGFCFQCKRTTRNKVLLPG